MARMKFLCDADRCIECNACVTACKNENEVPWGINRRRVVTINDGKPGERSVSMACMHCTDAPCASFNEQTLLWEFPRIQGDINQLDPRARVLIQPAGRTWDYFHQIVLRWIGAIAIIGTACGACRGIFLGRTTPHRCRKIWTQDTAVQTG
jgi:ferredoxin